MPKRWIAKWIGIPEKCMIDYRRPTLPAPEFRRMFVPEKTVEHPVVFLSGLGYFEWTVNGKAVTGDHLVPSPTQYDKRWRYMRYELDFPLEAGQNYLFSVKLGNGMYNCQSVLSPWHFDRATWRDYPKLILQLEDAGKAVFVTDSSWVVAYGATLYDSFRGGELYDARLEIPADLTEPEAEIIPHYEAWRWDPPAQHGKWYHAWIVPPPGGVGEEQTFPGCRVMATYEMRQTSPHIWAAPVQAGGVPELHVHGEAGAEIKMICGERLAPEGDKVDVADIGMFVQEYFQEDHYILKGEGEEVWHPQFTYHGFRYVEVEISGNAEITAMRQLVLYTDMKRIGRIECSNPELMLIDECAARANSSNFCGFPTDCPSREKNGWTSEATLMCEPFLYTFDGAEPYAAYVDTVIDTQRPSGQIAGIAPNAGWGYNWGSGGHWDLALYEIPLLTYLHSGKAEYLRRTYPAMKRNLEYHFATEDDGILCGLGDWYPPVRETNAPIGACPSASNIQALNAAIQVAQILGEASDAAEFSEALRYYKTKYNEHYYLGNGVYSGAHTTYPAMALNWHIVPESDRALCAKRLHEMILQNHFKVDFGTIGSRQVPMALFENNLADDALRMMTQPEYPGYQYMLKKRCNFTENWGADTQSLNHGAFTFAAGCLYKYVAGFRHVLEHPGQDYSVIAPVLPQGLNDFAAEYLGYRSAWQRDNGAVRFQITVPQGKAATLCLPNGRTEKLSGGTFEFTEKE